MPSFFRKVRLGYLIFIKYLARHFKAIILLLILSLAVGLVSWRFNLFQPYTFTEGMVGTYQEHDLPIEFTQLLSQGLVKPDKEGRMSPVLVTGWDTNNDATIFTFKLKDNLVWSDGTGLKASDIIFPLTGVEVSYPNDKTIVFKLSEKYSPFPTRLTRPIFKKGTLVGVGPYKVKKIEKSKIFISKIDLEPMDGKLPKMNVRFYPSEKTAITGFELGEIQAVFGVSFKNFAGASVLKAQQRTDYTKLVAIFYNNSDPVLGGRDNQIRQVLSYGAPIIPGEQEANNPIPPYSWAYNPAAKEYLGKKDEAKQLLEKVVKDQKKIKEQEIILTTTPQLEAVANQVVSSWREIGMNVVLRVESGIPQKFQALLITLTIPLDPDQYYLWHSTQTKTNITNYSFARTDKDLEDGRTLIDEEDRKQKYFDFQKIILDDAPATFLYFPQYNVVYMKKAEEDLQKVIDLQLLHLGS